MVRWFQQGAWTVVWVCLVVAGSLAAQAQVPSIEEEGGAKAGAKAVLVVSGSLADGADELQVRVSLAGHGSLPSIIVLTLTYDPAQLQFVADGVVSGPAALAAGKYAYGNVADVGEVRLIVWGLNTNTLGDGEIVRMPFDVLHPDGAGRLMVAGADASIADPGGAGIAADVVYFAPDEVTASQDRSDGVLVAWSGVAGAAGYRVYRNTTNDPGAAEALTDWFGSDVSSYLDTSDEALRAVAMQCARSGGLYYWVRARDADDQEGTLNAVPGLGSVSGGKVLAGFSVASRRGGLAFSAGAVGDILVLAFVAAALVFPGRRGRVGSTSRRAPVARRP